MGHKKQDLLSNPQLDTDHLELVLKTLLYNTPDNERSLGDLMLIDRILTSPEFPKTGHDYQFAVWELLTSTIIFHYQRHRTVHQLDHPSLECHIESALTYIRQEAQLQSLELLCWSWLYHRYVRVDLGITGQQFAEVISVDPRTLRRYGRHAVQRLTEKLIYDERKLRCEHRKNWLSTRLSLPVSVPVFGRDDLLNRIGQTIHNIYPQHLQVVGAEGIGKSTLVHKFIHQMIDNQQLDDLVWIQKSELSEDIDIRGSIKATFLRDGSISSLVDYCHRYQVAIVFDGVDQVDSKLLAELGGAIVIIIGHEYQQNTYMPAQVFVDELDVNAAKMYIRYLSHGYSRGADYLLSDGEIEQIYTLAGGHPSKIRVCLDEWWRDAVDQECTRSLIPISA